MITCLTLFRLWGHRNGNDIKKGHFVKVTWSHMLIGEQLVVDMAVTKTRNTIDSFLLTKRNASNASHSSDRRKNHNNFETRFHCSWNFH